MGSQSRDGELVPFPGRGEHWVTKRELAEHLSVSEKTIERWTADGMPRLSPVGRRTVRFQVSACEAWLGGAT